jgi:hypothetical protein
MSPPDLTTFEKLSNLAESYSSAPTVVGVPTNVIDLGKNKGGYREGQVTLPLLRGVRGVLLVKLKKNIWPQPNQRAPRRRWCPLQRPRAGHLAPDSTTR